MKTIFHNLALRTWVLGGLAGLTILTGVFLGDGQARTYSPSTGTSPGQVAILKPLIPLSLSQSMIKSEPPTIISGQVTNIPSKHKDIVTKKSAKKRMGLAMIFLGALAKKT